MEHLQIMQERNRRDVISKILQVVSEGATRMQIMDAAYLSFDQVNKFLSLMIEKGLIFYEEGVSRYRPTEKGASLLCVLEEGVRGMTGSGPARARAVRVPILA